MRLERRRWWKVKRIRLKCIKSACWFDVYFLRISLIFYLRHKIFSLNESPRQSRGNCAGYLLQADEAKPRSDKMPQEPALFWKRLWNALNPAYLVHQIEHLRKYFFLAKALDKLCHVEVLILNNMVCVCHFAHLNMQSQGGHVVGSKCT